MNNEELKSRIMELKKENEKLKKQLEKEEYEHARAECIASLQRIWELLEESESEEDEGKPTQEEVNKI
tara:strand:- start:1519 stop:1722 length:204 start_codon:yes stop_codon:yes gene_type:complete